VLLSIKLAVLHMIAVCTILW